MIVGVDLETTGLDWIAGHKIIEICLSLYSDDGKKLGSFESRVNPMRPIDAKAEAVHGISLGDLIGEPTFDKVAPRVTEIMQHTDVLVAHNGHDFDFPFLEHQLREALHVSFPTKMRLFDTKTNARWATWNGKSPKLEELAYSLDVEYDKEKAHGASYDVDVMMACFFEARRRGFFMTDNAHCPASTG
jgi:DNA polymerase-3 subunit epsilon